MRNWRSLLREKFKTKTNFKERQEQFTNIKQVQGQTVRDLAEKIEKITTEYVNSENSVSRDIENLLENLKLTKFLEALRSDLRMEVQKLGPKHFKQAIEIAQNVERAFNDQVNVGEIVQNLEINNLMQQQFESDKKIQQLQEELGKLRQERMDWEREKGNNKQPQCHICSRNHLTTECFYYRARNPTLNQMNNPNENGRQFRGRFWRSNGQFRGRFPNRPYRRNNQRSFRRDLN